MLAGLLVLATHALSRSELGESGGVLAATVLLGIPIFPIWGTLAYADMGWALFEFLMLFALVRWSRVKDPQWLVLSGVFAGLAASTSHLGLAGLLCGAVLVVLTEGIAGVRAWPPRAAPLHAARPRSLCPVVPAQHDLAGGPGVSLPVGRRGDMGCWPPGAAAELSALLRRGASLLDYLLLPIRLYTDHGLFGTFISSIEFPSFLFPLAVLLLLARPTAPLSGWSAPSCCCVSAHGHSVHSRRGSCFRCFRH